MANIAKYSNITSINNILRHNDRIPETYKNTDIDPTKSGNNYYLSPTLGVGSFSYFKNCMDNLYCYHRDNVVKMCEWVLTAPVGLTETETRLFFKLAYTFLVNRYYGGEKYCIQAVVHLDEKNCREHMHYCFIPAAKDEKHKCDKVCCWEVINRQELRDWHPALQKFLNEHGLSKAQVINGITRTKDDNKLIFKLNNQKENQQIQDYEVHIDYQEVDSNGCFRSISI